MASLRLVLVLVACLAAPLALAHKIQVFAFADGDRIEGSVYFPGGGAATSTRVRVLDPEGRAVADLETDAEGAFSYQARAPVDHLLVAETPDGHRAEWRVSAAELAPGFPGSAGSEGLRTSASDMGLGPLIEQAVARQIRPLREELLAAQGRAELRDVLGGIGYILGLAGLLAWWRSRRPPGPS
jgi:nickel transport protein